MAATVDSTGSANVNERVVLTIPQKTSGDAKQTSLVSLGLNFPADAQVITDSFNRANSATYNKSTAFTVYDNGGNGYLATIYYVKTANANQTVPFNKWQTYVFVGEDQVNASLVQATDANNERIYVNQYGQTQPYSKVKDELTTAKTQLFSLDELTAKKTSLAATVSSDVVDEKKYDFVKGIPQNDIAPVGGVGGTAGIFDLADAGDLFTVDIDSSLQPVTLNLTAFKSPKFDKVAITGDMVAQELTNQLVSKFGKARPTANPTATPPVVSVPNTERYGMKVVFDPVNKKFLVESGMTGDNSSVNLSIIQDKEDLVADYLGFKASPTDAGKLNTPVERVATRGIASLPAIAYGATPTVNIATNFNVDETNNKFIVTVDGIKKTVTVPINEYSLSEFTNRLQAEINDIAESRTDGITPKEINGVKVEYDLTRKAFKFTSGTTGSDSFIKISGEPIWGLSAVEAARGSTSSWIKPTQHVDVVNGTPQPKYIDGEGNETTSSDGYVGLPAWSPVYLDKGELTFDTGGNLVSPAEGTQLETVYLAGGKGALTINIDYSASTQFSSAFAVLSQSQDGAPEGDLVGVTIGNDGLVSASFSNGSQKSLAKILLANFSSPVGLRQIGDSSFLTSAASGKPILGTPGSAGFGTLRAGATERANVDLTQELVDLITAQRNFQANAKAIETSSTMTSAIINLRS
jgi:flagellar hook protein FlgE